MRVSFGLTFEKLLLIGLIAVFLIRPEGVVVRELFGIGIDELSERLDVPVRRTARDGS